ncbi:hypothetical protein GCM10023339_70510 [Alloalcanivorax gelatiniphagus]
MAALYWSYSGGRVLGWRRRQCLCTSKLTLDLQSGLTLDLKSILTLDLLERGGGRGESELTLDLHEWTYPRHLG